MRIITLDTDNKVISVKNVGNNYVLGINDIKTDLGEMGQIMQSDGTFITPEPVPTEPVKSLDEQILELKEKQALSNQLLADNSLAQQELLELLIDMGVI